MHAEGWKLRLPPGHKTYLVRFRQNGRRTERSTGQSDPGKAAEEAAKIYAAVVTGRSAVRVTSTAFDTTVASFLADYELSHADGTFATVKTYFRAHVIPFFGSFDAFTPLGYADYSRARIGKVTRATLRKELSALRQFVDWCGQHGVPLPPVPPLPKQGHPGVRAKNARKRKATILTPSEAARLLAAMPVRSRNTKAWVRPLFTVLWETGLRPITVLKLEAPLHYSKGAARLFISREIDKEQFERHVPLSKAARGALDLVCPPAGKLFPVSDHALRTWLEAAVAKVGMTDRKISVYDFKHSRISLDANSGAPLAGIAHLVGHKHVSTTALYVTSGEDAASAVLASRTAQVRKNGQRPRGNGRDGRA